MQKRPKGWETARDDPNHIGELLVTINGKEYAAQDVVSCEIERNLLENTAEVGNATAAVLTLEINQGEAIPKRAKVVVQYRLALDDARTDYIPKGTYWINTREKDGRYLKLTCYDAMLMAQQDYLGDVTADDWPQQETACAAEIAQRMGVEIDQRTKIGTGDNHQVSMPVGRTMREVLEQIAAANGGNWCITPAGKLLLVPFAGTGDVLPAVSGAPDCGDVQAITGVRVVRNDTDTPLLAGDETGTVLEVENENGTQALADELAQKLVGLQYAPYTCDQRYIDPVAETGDKITVGGVACVAYNIKESLGPSHYADLEAPAEAGELEEEYPYQSAAERVKKQLGTVTASMAEIRKDQKSIEAEVSKTTETVAKNTQDIEAARKEATEKSEAAAAAAKKYADDKLLEYSTTEEVKSLVSQTAENITSEVSKTYATKATVEEAASSATEAANKAAAAQAAADAANAEAEAAKSNAATAQEAADKAKADAEAAQKAAEDAEANAAADATEKAEAARKAAEEAAAADAAAKAAQAEANAKTAAAEDAKAKADQALADAKTYTNEQLKSYSTTEETKSLIDQKADSITLNVTKTVTESVTKEVDGKLGDYVTKTEVKTEVKSAVDVEVGKIQLGVSAGGWLDDLYASLTTGEKTVTAPTTAGSTRNSCSYWLPSDVLSRCNGAKGKLVVQYKVTEDVSRIADDTVTTESAINFWQNYSSGNVGYTFIWLARRDGATTQAGDWQTIEYTFDFKNEMPTGVYVYLYLSAGTGQVTIKQPQLFLQDGKSSNIILTKDGVEISSSTLDLSGFTGNNEVRSKFAMDTGSVTISSGTITFSGNTLIIDSDNFKLSSAGEVEITGHLKSIDSSGNRAELVKGALNLYAYDTNRKDSVLTASIWPGGGTNPHGVLDVYGRDTSGNVVRQVQIRGSQTDGEIMLMHADGNMGAFFSAASTATNTISGNLNVKGETGLGVTRKISCQNIDVSQAIKAKYFGLIDWTTVKELNIHYVRDWDFTCVGFKGSI